MMVVGLLRIEYAEKDGEWKLGLNYDILKREDANDIETRTAKAIENLLLGITEHVANQEGIQFQSTVISDPEPAAASGTNADGVPFHVCTQCEPHHVDNCCTCIGYGLILGESFLPVSAGGDTNIEFVPCPECGGTPAGHSAAAPGGDG